MFDGADVSAETVFAELEILQGPERVEGSHGHGSTRLGVVCVCAILVCVYVQQWDEC